MRLVFHPGVEADIRRIMRYYAEVGGETLSEEFYAELRSYFVRVARAPERYASYERDLRRASLKRFPYHFLYRISGGVVRILVVRHHRRRPTLGLSRR